MEEKKGRLKSGVGSKESGLLMISSWEKNYFCYEGNRIGNSKKNIKVPGIHLITNQMYK